MANTYELMSVAIDTSNGVNKATFNIRVTDPLTGLRDRFEKVVVNPPAPAQARIDGIVADAIAYANAQYPGMNLTTPQGS